MPRKSGDFPEGIDANSDPLKKRMAAIPQQPGFRADAGRRPLWHRSLTLRGRRTVL